MASRSIKFHFSAGESVLCFEPDATKARVIYEARILDTTIYRDKDGKRQSGYHIHFLRWNQSWDRVVNESFVLKNSDENRNLMKQLAEVARKVRKNRTRRKNISDILTEAFNGKPPPFESETDDSDEENTTDTGTNDTGDESMTESDSASSESKTEEKTKKPFVNVELEIPEALKIILDKDYFAINQDRKLVKLPSEINVVTVLESFVKTFMLDFWNPSFNRTHFCQTPPKIAIERILPVCKEFVDGIKICFDFVLPLILLYTPEKDQYTRISNMYKHKSPAKQKLLTEDSPLIQSPRSRSSICHSLALDEPSPKLPKLSPNIFNEEQEDEEITFMPRRRVTRSTTVDSPKKGGDTDNVKEGDTTTSNQKNDKDKGNKTEKQTGSHSHKDKTVSEKHHKSDKTEPNVKQIKTRRSSDRLDEGLKRRPLRNYRKSSDTSSDSDHSKPDTVLSEPVKNSSNNVKPEKSERPPPLLIPCNILSTRQNGAAVVPDKGPPGSTDSLGDSGKEEILDNILSWQMLPPQIQCQLPTPPSLLYGAQHLLRLFVKLPELLGKMDIDDNKLGVLLKLLQQFLLYLSEHLSELFPDAAYSNNHET